MVKKVMESTLGDLVEKFNRLVKFKWHNFNISKKFAFVRALKAGLSDNEYIIHIEFNLGGHTNRPSCIQVCYTRPQMPHPPVSVR